MRVSSIDGTTGQPPEHGSADPAPCRVVVCRDCCCGSPKVTGVDHAAQTTRLSADVPVRISACLDVCDQANVMVVQPSAAGRAAGARPVWLGLVNDPAATEDIAAWVRAGGPGIAPQPAILDLYTFTPPRRRTSFSPVRGRGPS
ncbi:(2Fe-2S) ferredoxin domain-containing protein [Streptomyces sp. NPDC046931]|uniref:(2Fe-2S) ferredoxin domain-containing protein n=1 Tax=Streptomyces sp. NPDC046931 TaxID=3154806 RepID=UPI0033DBD50E